MIVSLNLLTAFRLHDDCVVFLTYMWHVLYNASNMTFTHEECHAAFLARTNYYFFRKNSEAATTTKLKAWMEKKPSAETATCNI